MNASNVQFYLNIYEDATLLFYLLFLLYKYVHK